MMNNDLYQQLSEAIEKKDIALIKEIQTKILNGEDRDTVSESFVKAIEGKTLYKNLKRAIKESNSFDSLDYMKLVSSLLTHNIIEAQIHQKPLNDYPINELYILLGNFISGEEKAINEAKEFISNKYAKFL